MTQKFGRNDPCWCGSDLKYKHCHLDREKETPLQPWEVAEKFRAFFSYKYCLHPNVGNECGKKIIKAHTVQKNGGLNYIAKDGHVYGFKLTTKMFNQEKLLPERIGINHASTFSGFCNIHDIETFQAVEKIEITFSDEQIFLFAYRSLCREIYYKAGHLDILKYIRSADKGRPLTDQLFVKTYVDMMYKGANAGLRDLNSYKNMFDRKLLHKDFSGFEYCVIELAAPPTVMCTSGFSPEVDFAGNFLQSLEDPNVVMELVTCSLIGYEEKGAAVFVWPSNCGYSRRLIESLLALPQADIPNAIVKLVFEFSENVFFSEDWWIALDADSKDKIAKRIFSGANGVRTRNCLIDDESRFVDWQVENIRHNL